MKRIDLDDLPPKLAQLLTSLEEGEEVLLVQNGGVAGRVVGGAPPKSEAPTEEPSDDLSTEEARGASQKVSHGGAFGTEDGGEPAETQDSAVEEADGLGVGGPAEGLDRRAAEDPVRQERRQERDGQAREGAQAADDGCSLTRAVVPARPATSASKAGP